MEDKISRRDIPFTNEHFVQTLLALQALGSPYWYGTCMYRCKDSLLKSKSKQYPSHYTRSRMDRYREDIAKKRIASDCVGAIKGYCWTNGGEGLIEAFGTDKSFTSKYGSNNCPDKSANGMFEWAKKHGMDWGTIDTIPEIPGVLVRYDGHVGVYAGDGKVVEWRGFKYGSQVTELKKRGWKHWYKHPAIRYGEAAEPVLGDRLLKKGMKGADVEMLQRLLNQLGYALEIDGDFGEETESAVSTFQSAEGLESDGEYGEKTHAALSAKTDGQVVISGGDCWIRSLPDVSGQKLGVAKEGEALPYAGEQARNGWLKTQKGWVSGKYAKLQEGN